jgi:hypothetical protein
MEILENRKKDVEELMKQQLNRKIKLSALLISFLLLGLGCGPKQTTPEVPVSTDPRVELMSLIFRLAGNPEYNRGRIEAYNQDVDEHFSAFKDHEAVKTAVKLREERGVSYDAVMGMAVHLFDAFSLAERIPFDPQPDTLDSRWTTDNAREFLEVVRQFVKDTDFKSFIETHSSLYDLAATRMQAVMDEHGVIDWFDSFFGDRPGARFELLLGILNGPANYGARIRISADDEILYCILGVWGTDEDGQPSFDERVLSTVVHEFSHSYCNPLVDKYAEELEPLAKPIFARVEKAMRSMAYGHWNTMMRESLVRASVIRYLAAKQGEEAAEKRVQTEKERKFFWMDGLVNLLGEYEQNRDTYPTLDDFFPRITAYFEAYIDRLKDDIKAYEEAERKRMEEIKAKSPKIVSTVPPNGAQDVDPDLKAIIITFDRPMNKSSYAVMRFSDKFPPRSGKASYDETGTVFTIPVKLEPGKEYEFGLNSKSVFAFMSAKEEVLYPVVFRFRTRGK